MKYLLMICVDEPFEADPEDLDPQPWVDDLDAAASA